PAFPIKDRSVGSFSTKKYPHSAQLAALLHTRFPGLAIVQIGARETSTPISAEFDLTGKTTLGEAAEIIRRAALHIDNEGGLTHIARCLGITCCVIFGSTPVDYFGYPANINMRPPFCGGCYWSTPEWMVECPRGFAEARCMSEQPPEAVLEAVTPFLKK